MKKFIIGIDASRCRSGGAYSHMIGILSNFNPEFCSIKQIHIWSHHKMLKLLPDYPWLIKHNPPSLEGNNLNQLFWQTIKLANDLKKYSCDILITADASSLCRFNPQVVLSRDMLSYEPGIMQKYNWGKKRLRILLILWLQNAAFRHAAGVIFLTHYAAKVIQNSCGILKNYKVIPHGVGNNFKNIVSERKWTLGERPINCLYVSNAELYKNQWHVVKAIELLRKEGFDIELTLVGGGSGKAQKMLEQQIANSDPSLSFVKQIAFIPQKDLLDYISTADIYVFASGCEAFGITLLEGMAAGLPIACSNKSCLPELIDNAGVLFDPENPKHIAHSIKSLMEDKALRDHVSKNAKTVAQKYSWSRCADETFSFVIETLNKYINV